MTADNPDLLDRLIAIRKWRGLSQGQVADRMYLARPLISMIETRRRPARLEFLESYARIIGAQIGAWPIPIPEPSEVKQPPCGSQQIPIPGAERNGDAMNSLSSISRIGAGLTGQLSQQPEVDHVH